MTETISREEWDKLSPFERHGAIKRGVSVPQPKHASTMNDTEFALALKNKSWRNKPDATLPQKPVMDMSDTEFETAMRFRAWRNTSKG